MPADVVRQNETQPPQLMHNYSEHLLPTNMEIPIHPKNNDETSSEQTSFEEPPSEEPIELEPCMLDRKLPDWAETDGDDEEGPQDFITKRGDIRYDLKLGWKP